jgi:hypothetical protein
LALFVCNKAKDIFFKEGKREQHHTHTAKQEQRGVRQNQLMYTKKGSKFVIESIPEKERKKKDQKSKVRFIQILPHLLLFPVLLCIIYRLKIYLIISSFNNSQQQWRRANITNIQFIFQEQKKK